MDPSSPASPDPALETEISKPASQPRDPQEPARRGDQTGAAGRHSYPISTTNRGTISKAVWVMKRGSQLWHRQSGISLHIHGGRQKQGWEDSEQRQQSSLGKL
ncbi:hypothetical protein GDO81_009788 [Engystomops pustulosus]|uniref:Uncharacterized protein n=1 Tax=Engystomops pustulosus TaxID=76066 RepID=A0AAV7BV07_ENGPU|nr:hypothetical protein GDO81_009788 [Engystomops pustulosus]